MIAVECYLDYYIVSELGVRHSDISHEAGKGGVLRSLRKGLANLGIIDEDPESYQPRDMANYVEITNIEGLKLLKRTSEPHTFLIVIPIRLEDWLLIRAQKARIDPQTYGLPNNPSKLHDFPHIEKVPNFQPFWRELKKVDPIFITLRDWLTSS